ncbi:RDD family protein [Frankia nepalensis]|uniref:RDD family protein n=1 Tax=Frankia nepalensis TaxID=1836974 RepID=UPI0027DCBAB4|nr:RDD family protein [Frankia nepalensis]
MANLLAGVPMLFGVVYHGTARGTVVIGIFLLMEIVLISTTGQTIGRRLFGIGVTKVPGGGLPAFPRVILRTLVLSLFIPALLVDRDMRGLHDRAAGTVLIRAARRA